MEPAELEAVVRDLVTQKLDALSMPTLAQVPWQVRGHRPIFEDLQHAGTQTRARVWVLDDHIWVSLGAPASGGVQHVGWYDAGEVPPEVRGAR